MDDRIVSFLVLGWVTLASKERQASSIGYRRISASSKQLTGNRNAEEVLKVFQQAKARGKGDDSDRSSDDGLIEFSCRTSSFDKESFQCI